MSNTTQSQLVALAKQKFAEELTKRPDSALRNGLIAAERGMAQSETNTASSVRDAVRGGLPGTAAAQGKAAHLNPLQAFALKANTASSVRAAVHRGLPADAAVKGEASELTARQAFLAQENTAASLKGATQRGLAQDASAKGQAARGTAARANAEVAVIAPPLAATPVFKRLLALPAFLTPVVGPILSIGLFRSAKKDDRLLAEAAPLQDQAATQTVQAVQGETKASVATIAAANANAQGVTYRTQYNMIQSEMQARSLATPTPTQTQTVATTPTPGLQLALPTLGASGAR